jgi:hypothetical protein
MPLAAPIWAARRKCLRRESDQSSESPMPSARTSRMRTSTGRDRCLAPAIRFQESDQVLETAVKTINGPAPAAADQLAEDRGDAFVADYLPRPQWSRNLGGGTCPVPKLVRTVAMK